LSLYSIIPNFDRDLSTNIIDWLALVICESRLTSKTLSGGVEGQRLKEYCCERLHNADLMGKDIFIFDERTEISYRGHSALRYVESLNVEIEVDTSVFVI